MILERSDRLVPRSRPGWRSLVTPEVSLCEVTAETLRAVLALSVRPEQAAYVASNAQSIAEAHFHPEAWFRAIFAGDQPVGFLMLHDENLRPEPRQDDFYYLWRFMIDARHQGRGHGRDAMALLVEHVRARPNARVLLTSCHPGPESPEGFYRKLGFTATGRDLDGELELALEL
jgi:diamine N-acetyltransferase